MAKGDATTTPPYALGFTVGSTIAGVSDKDFEAALGRDEKPSTNGYYTVRGKWQFTSHEWQT